MRENCTSGTVPGAPGNRSPYGGYVPIRFWKPVRYSDNPTVETRIAEACEFLAGIADRLQGGAPDSRPPPHV